MVYPVLVSPFETRAGVFAGDDRLPVTPRHFPNQGARPLNSTLGIHPRARPTHSEPGRALGGQALKLREENYAYDSSENLSKMAGGREPVGLCIPVPDGDAGNPASSNLAPTLVTGGSCGPW